MSAHLRYQLVILDSIKHSHFSPSNKCTHTWGGRSVGRLVGRRERGDEVGRDSQSYGVIVIIRRQHLFLFCCLFCVCCVVFRFFPHLLSFQYHLSLCPPHSFYLHQCLQYQLGLAWLCFACFFTTLSSQRRNVSRIKLVLILLIYTKAQSASTITCHQDENGEKETKNTNK